MTRVNVGIPPQNLTDQHLLAEHREIKRIPRVSVDTIPKTFCLGKGHVKFFTNKQGYIFDRYKEIYEECKKRGFQVQDFSENFTEKTGNYVPSREDICIIQTRIENRIRESSLVFRYYGKPITKEEALELLYR